MAECRSAREACEVIAVAAGVDLSALALRDDCAARARAFGLVPETHEPRDSDAHLALTGMAPSNGVLIGRHASVRVALGASLAHRRIPDRAVRT